MVYIVLPLFLISVFFDIELWQEKSPYTLLSFFVSLILGIIFINRLIKFWQRVPKVLNKNNNKFNYNNKFDITYNSPDNQHFGISKNADNNLFNDTKNPDNQHLNSGNSPDNQHFDKATNPTKNLYNQQINTGLPYSSSESNTFRNKNNKFGFDWSLPAFIPLIDTINTLISRNKFSADDFNPINLPNNIWVNFYNKFKREEEKFNEKSKNNFLLFNIIGAQNLDYFSNPESFLKAMLVSLAEYLNPCILKVSLRDKNFNYFQVLEFSGNLFVSEKEKILDENTWKNIFENIEKGKFIISETEDELFFPIPTTFGPIGLLHFQLLNKEKITSKKLIEKIWLEIRKFGQLFYERCIFEMLSIDPESSLKNILSFQNDLSYAFAENIEQLKENSNFKKLKQLILIQFTPKDDTSNENNTVKNLEYDSEYSPEIIPEIKSEINFKINLEKNPKNNPKNNPEYNPEINSEKILENNPEKFLENLSEDFYLISKSLRELFVFPARIYRISANTIAIILINIENKEIYEKALILLKLLNKKNIKINLGLAEFSLEYTNIQDWILEAQSNLYEFK